MKEFRPSSLNEVFGQEHLKPILHRWINDLSQVPQSLLLHGPYGMGKTSIARILASKIASESDIHEMNAAAARGIDDVRAIAEDTVFSGLSGNKVYIIDELHMMTPQAQSALLKVIEEPQPGIYFMLCTTDYAKLLDTIRSRCTKLELRLLSESEGMALIDHVGGKDLPENLKTQIFLASGGHARDIVKQTMVGLSNPTAITSIVVNINESVNILAKWFQGQAVDVWQVLNLDEPGMKQLNDYVADNPTILGNYMTKDNYHNILLQRANATLYLISQKQRLLHLILLRY